MKKTLQSLVLVGAFLGSALFVNSCKKENIKNKIESPDYYSHFIAYEGKRNKVYDPNPRDNKYEPTIGVGHYLDGPGSRESFENALPEINYDLVYSKKKKLTDEEVRKLFDYDLAKKINDAKEAFDNFDSYPNYLKIALVDGFYRGDLKKSPKTQELIRQGKFYEASIEYLNHKEYKNAKKNKMRGVFNRMNSNSKAMLKYSKENKITTEK